ncbi:hypothetical protein M0R45_026413 [Rubus argutus]|uniref:Uncharacterized protein n=1 Tax=Rubus argutus TaxID=59490 RepID=A0AAW1X127_RUBAR
MSKQFRSFHEFIQPSDLDYEGWLEELPRGAVKNSDLPKGKELQISSLIGPSNLGSPEEDSDPSSESDMGPSQLKFKRRKYDRYTTQQLEEFITKNPHPDENEKGEMARRLHLQPKQITYWIQNYKTRKRVRFSRGETDALKEEIVKLHAKLKRCEEALTNTTCLVCGGPSNVNKGLDCRSQVLEAGPNVEKGKSPLEFPEAVQQTRENFLHTKDGQDLVAKLVVAAMEELVMMAYGGAPLWIPAKKDGPPNQPNILNKVEYLRIFPRDPNHSPKKFWPETSRDSAVVLMDPINIVKILMDAKQWSTVFGNIVSKARTLEVLTVGVDESFNEALHEITAEFHLPSPLVLVREHHFIRYCRQYYDNLWVVVDTDLSGVFQDPTVKSYRRPSGCLIQALPDGYSKVTWVENTEVDDEDIHNLYFPLIISGTTFGAKRWVLTLEGQCQRLVSSMVTPHNPISLGVIYDDKGKQGLCNLARRMMVKFYSDVSASTDNHWSTSSEYSESGEMQSMVRVNTVDPGIPMGTIFSAVSSLWWPASPNEIFELLQNYQS